MDDKIYTEFFDSETIRLHGQPAVGEETESRAVLSVGMQR